MAITVHETLDCPPQTDELVSHSLNPVDDATNELSVDIGLLNFLERLETLKSGSELRKRPELLNIERTKVGDLERYGFTTINGYSYDAVVGLPSKQTTDIPVLSTGAWFTSSHGHNEHAMLHMMRSGSPVIFVGAEGSHHPHTFIKPKTNISMAGSAAATLNFAKEASNQHSSVIDSVKRMLIGESRGAMVGMGIIAIDQLFGQEVVFADLTAPCFPRRFIPEDILRIPGHLPNLPISIGRLAMRLGIKRLVHYPATIDPHPYAMAHQIAIGPALLSGEAGDLARLITPEKIIHITCFDHDFASMKSEWQKIFANHPNVRITPLKGSHLTIADPETLAYIEARKQAYHQIQAEQGSNLDGRAVFERAHQLIAA